MRITDTSPALEPLSSVILRIRERLEYRTCRRTKIISILNLQIILVCMRNMWPIRPALFSCFCSMKRLPLDWMLVHRRVTPSIKFAGTHFYTWAERGTLLPKNTAQCPQSGLNPEASALTMRPPCLQQFGTTICKLTLSPVVGEVPATLTSKQDT